MGALAALGFTLAAGLARGGGGLRDRALGGSATLLVLVLGLSGSRGASLALGVGLCVLVALRSPGTRVAAALAGGTALVVGGGAWALAVRLDAGGLELLGLVVVAALVGALDSGFPERLATRRVLALLFAASASVAVVGVTMTQPVATTSSFRSAYWVAALDEARARPALGSGARNSST